MKSAIIVERATYIWFLLLQDVAPWLNRKTYPDVSLHLSMSPSQLASL